MLVIQLKLFPCDGRYPRKLDVSFPLISWIYVIMPVIFHPAAIIFMPSRITLIGTPPGCHYNAYYNNPLPETWPEFNIILISSFPTRSLVSRKAYILYVQEETTSSVWFKSEKSLSPQATLRFNSFEQNPIKSKWFF